MVSIEMCVMVLVRVCVSLCVNRVVDVLMFFFFQAEDGIRDLVRSRGLGDVYKRQQQHGVLPHDAPVRPAGVLNHVQLGKWCFRNETQACLLYTSDAADERSSVDLGGRRIIKKKTDTSIERKRIEQHRRA